MSDDFVSSWQRNAAHLAAHGLYDPAEEHDACGVGLIAAIERLFLALGHATGKLLTWMLLVPMFYGFFMPFGWLMRRGLRDRLKRHLEPDAETYWEPHAGPTAASISHERQY